MRKTPSLTVHDLLITCLVVAFAFGISAAPRLAQAADECVITECFDHQPSYGAADVDGSSAEWNLTGDFFANMHRAGDSTKEVEAKLYLRYDCTNRVMYVLVLAEPGVDILADLPSDSYVKINKSKKVDGNSGDNGIPPDFTWIGRSGDRAYGWEASFDLDPKLDFYSLNVHAQVWHDGQQTAAVIDRDIDLCVRCLDFGDLPNSYNMTSVAQNGARHQIGNLYLGSGIDGEPDGQPNLTATGDDNTTAPLDEDGVVRIANAPNYWKAGSGTVQVTVTGGSGCLTAWLDFWDENANSGAGGLGTDNDFDDPGEKIINNVELAAGTHTLNFTLPLDAATYPMYARFRLFPLVNGSCNYYTNNPVSPTGYQENGEVEDYLFNFNSTAVALQRFNAKPGEVTQASSAALALIAMSLGLLTLLWKVHSGADR